MDHIDALLEEAWAKFGGTCLWNISRGAGVSPMTIARALRTNGNMDAWKLAQRILDLQAYTGGGDGPR